MDKEKEIIAEAKRFFELVSDEVCPLFLPPDQIEILDEDFAGGYGKKTDKVSDGPIKAHFFLIF